MKNNSHNSSKDVPKSSFKPSAQVHSQYSFNYLAAHYTNSNISISLNSVSEKNYNYADN